ncbi:MAG: stage III sporulation protein AE [Bacillota bacterium]
MMRVLTISLMVLLLAAVPLTVDAAADEVTDDLTRRQMEGVDLGPLDDFARDLQREIGEDLPRMDLPSVVDRMRRGEEVFSLRLIAGLLLRYVGGEVLGHLGLVAQLVVLSLLSSLLSQAEGAWGQETVSMVARWVIYLALAAVAMVTFREAFGLARSTVHSLTDVMLALLPTLTTLLAASGAFTTAAILHPMVLFVCHAVVQVVVNWVFPLLFAAVMLELAGHFTPERPLARLAALFRKGSLWVLEAAMVIFVGVVTVQGVAGAVTDGVTLRSIKFAAKSLIPVLGSTFSDAGEMVMASSSLLKNATGLLGLFLVAMIAALPILRLAAMTVAYRAGAALAAPLGGPDISDLLDVLSDGMMGLTVAVGAVALMFYLTITIMLGAGNATVMLR